MPRWPAEYRVKGAAKPASMRWGGAVGQAHGADRAVGETGRKKALTATARESNDLSDPFNMPPV